MAWQPVSAWYGRPGSQCPLGMADPAASVHLAWPTRQPVDPLGMADPAASVHLAWPTRQPVSTWQGQTSYQCPLGMAKPATSVLSIAFLYVCVMWADFYPVKVLKK